MFKSVVYVQVSLCINAVWSYILKAIKNATGTSDIFPINISLIHFKFVLTSVINVGERFTKTWAQLYTSVKNFGEKNTNSSNFLVTILNLEILFNFSVQVLRFTQTNKKTVYNKKITLLEGPKIYVLNFNFRKISPKFEKSLKLQFKRII